MHRDSAAEFDRWAPAYHDCVLQPLYQAAHRAVLATAVRLCPSPRRMLDVGCGTGRLLGAAACRFPRTALIGADISAVMLATAGGSCPAAGHARCVQAAAERLPFADMAFDVVTSTVSFRHWTDPHAGLRETCRVLTPGGFLILADVFDPRRRNWISRLQGRSTPPQVLTRPALSAIGLDVMMTDHVPGFGPLPQITVITAQRNDEAHRSAAGLGRHHGHQRSPAAGDDPGFG
jgi:ubiquinone/menaquinone biosynthesis C-methylase UbiE